MHLPHVVVAPSPFPTPGTTLDMQYLGTYICCTSRPGPDHGQVYVFRLRNPAGSLVCRLSTSRGFREIRFIEGNVLLYRSRFVYMFHRTEEGQPETSCLEHEEREHRQLSFGKYAEADNRPVVAVGAGSRALGTAELQVAQTP